MPHKTNLKSSATVRSKKIIHIDYPLKAIEKVVCLWILNMKYFRETQIRWFGWLHNAKLELFLTMLVIPLLINIFIFWMTDNFLMLKNMKKYKVSSEGQSIDRYLANPDSSLVVNSK